MHNLADIYKTSLGLLTDLYELTMAYGYWKHKLHERQACFHLFFRHLPFKGGYAIAAGLEWAMAYLRGFEFSEEDIHYLSQQKGDDGQPLFEQGFLDYLKEMAFSCSVDAIPEGTVVYPHQPLLRVRGPLIQAQLLETALLNIINFQTLIATKAARLKEAAPEDVILEFGLRRAQGIDGGLSASRAAYIGGCDATSNTLAGKLFGIPVKGTIAHSWVMAYEEEQEAFDRWVEAMPNNSILLVDTYDSLTGVKRAIHSAKKLKAKGKELAGIRLDSGDLAFLSQEARRLLDEAGLHKTKIVASNELDEHLIESLKKQGCQIDIWGVGTKLAAAYDQPALGGVYKLAALQNEKGIWEWRLKLSEQAIKISNPGLQQVRRFRKEGRYRGDMIFDSQSGPQSNTITDPGDFTRQKTFGNAYQHEDLLVPIFDAGKQVYQSPEVGAIRQRVKDQIKMLHPTIRRLDNPHEYPVGLESSYFDRKAELVKHHRRHFQNKKG